MKNLNNLHHLIKYAYNLLTYDAAKLVKYEYSLWVETM